MRYMYRQTDNLQTVERGPVYHPSYWEKNGYGRSLRLSNEETHAEYQYPKPWVG